MQSPTPMSQYDSDPEWIGWLDDVVTPPPEVPPKPSLASPGHSKRGRDIQAIGEER